MKLLVQFVRILVAITFIFSGFVKMIDPIGTKIKMLEYFSEDVLNVTFLSPYTLEISIFLILLEFGLGIWLLLGYKPKFTLKALLILILFFLFLTGYSAIFNKVTDCGCFGDAVKLTNWETFYKNIILLLLILFLNWQQAYIKPVFSKSLTSVIAYSMVLLSLFLMIYTVRHL
ncbi:MAG TPA: DoxX family membrane protein, partial [Flavobacteriales bacterium]|nr:DoxX family membrane protein [Flavobacteriales bacterium]